jgi:hypothetical protein
VIVIAEEEMRDKRERGINACELSSLPMLCKEHPHSQVETERKSDLEISPYKFHTQFSHILRTVVEPRVTHTPGHIPCSMFHNT